MDVLDDCESMTSILYNSLLSPLVRAIPHEGTDPLRTPKCLGNIHKEVFQ